MNQVNTIIMKYDMFCKSDADDKRTFIWHLQLLTPRSLQLLVYVMDRNKESKLE